MGHFLCEPMISGHRRDWGRHRLVEVSSLGYGYGNGYGMRQTHVWTLDSFPCELIMEGTQESEVSNCQRKFTWDETDTHWVSFLFADYASAQKRQTICRHMCGHQVPLSPCVQPAVTQLSTVTLPMFFFLRNAQAFSYLDGSSHYVY